MDEGRAEQMDEERLVMEGDTVFREEPRICYKPGTGYVVTGYDRYKVMDKKTFIAMMTKWSEDDLK